MDPPAKVVCIVCDHTWGRSNFEGGRVQIFASGRRVVKNCPGRGMKLFFQGGGRIGESYKNGVKFSLETIVTNKKVAVLAIWKKTKKLFSKKVVSTSSYNFF